MPEKPTATRRRRRALLAALCVAALTSAVASAQEKAMEKPMQHGMEHEMEGGMSHGAVKAAYLRSWDDAAKKIVSLAEAVPADKYTWRPMDGVRSFSEVFEHVAGGNYFILSAAGVKPPEGLSRDMEKETDKAKVIATLKESLEHARKGIDSIPESEYGKEIKFFNRPGTVADPLVLALSHLHEHLGQAIAYARMNHIVPPWSK